MKDAWARASGSLSVFCLVLSHRVSTSLGLLGSFDLETRKQPTVTSLWTCYFFTALKGGAAFVRRKTSLFNQNQPKSSQGQPQIHEFQQIKQNKPISDPSAQNPRVKINQMCGSQAAKRPVAGVAGQAAPQPGPERRSGFLQKGCYHRCPFWLFW